MNFKSLAKYLNSFSRTYGIPGCDCTVYYKHENVFRNKQGYSNEEKTNKVGYKDFYFMHSATKLINCVAVMRLAEEKLLSLDDKVTKFIPDFNRDTTMREMLALYSQTLDSELHKYNFHNLSAIVHKVTGKSLDDYLCENVFEPLKMKNSSFTLNEVNSKRICAQYIMNPKTGIAVPDKRKLEELWKKNEGCLITTVDDYAMFAETLCNKGVSKNGYRLLNSESVDELINNIIYNETTSENVFVCIGFNGSLVIIDTQRKITVVYAQHVKKCGAEQMEIYPKIREIAYRCLGVNHWSQGFNVFP